MTETTQMPPPPPGDAGRQRSPEYRLARNSLQGLREDLFRDPFAYRPLPHRRTDGPFVRRLPGRMRTAAERLPHAVIAGIALFTLMIGALSGSEPGGDGRALLTGLLCALPVLEHLAPLRRRVDAPADPAEVH
ncbi:hypothetical protein ACWEGM_37240, partial [Streptomyces nigra]